VSAPTRTIETISFGPDGVRVSFIASTDVRAEGEIFQMHTIGISWARESLREAMQELEAAADRLLDEAIPEWAGSRPVDLEAEHQQALEEDEDEGLGG
jgi:hypothetical protein